jgi:division protein CdvB (Snf7/Vps24/ESCRT-III family)
MTMSKWVKSESVVTSTDDSSSPSVVSPKPGGPLRPRLEAVQKRIENQIGRLDGLQSSMKVRDEETFRKLMASIKESNAQYSTVLSAELAKARQVSRVVSIAKVALEKIHGRLSAVSDFGDLVIVLSPAMAVVKNVRSSLVPFVPEMEEELGIISELLSGILVDAGQVGGYTINFETANEEAVRLVDEASNTVEHKMREELPGIPDLPMVSTKVA